MKRIIFLITALLYTFSYTLPSFAAITTPEIKEAAKELQLDAEAAIVMDAKTGEIIFEKNIDEKLYPASITKLMTVLLVLENCEKDDLITFSHDAVFSIEPGSSHIAIVPDETLTVEQCLYGIMLQSANEVSNAVGEHIDGSMEEFSKHMTKRAKELGCENTNFVNANGLHDENHYTTARDMALIGKELLKFPYFKEVASSTYYEIPPTSMQSETRYLHGQNQLLKPASKFYYEYCIGGKTGFTNEARNTLVAFAKKGDTELVSVVLKSTGYGEYTDTISLFEYGFNNYHTVEIDTKSNIMGSFDVTKQNSDKVIDTIDGVLAESVFATIPSKYNASNVEKNIDMDISTDTFVSKGDKVGEAEYILDNEVIAKEDILSQRDVIIPETFLSKIDFSKIIKISVLIIIGISIVTTICIKIIIKINKKKKRKRKTKKNRRNTQYNYNYKN